jgi:hypothetical protein
MRWARVYQNKKGYEKSKKSRLEKRRNKAKEALGVCD